MNAQKFRIVEWISEFRNGAREVSFELEYQDRQHKWASLGKSGSLKETRTAVLLYLPADGFGYG